MGFRVAVVSMFVLMVLPAASAQLPPAQVVVLSGGATPFVANSIGGRMDNRGVVTFAARLSGVPSDQDFGIWRSGGGGSSYVLVREGDPAPGIADAFLTPGNTFLPLATPLFSAGLTGSVDTSNNGALYHGSQIVVRKGDRAPGTPEGVYFG